METDDIKEGALIRDGETLRVGSFTGVIKTSNPCFLVAKDKNGDLFNIWEPNCEVLAVLGWTSIKSE